MSYDMPIRRTITLPAAAIATAATLIDVSGPKGMQGRLASIDAVVTTDTTVAATVIQVGDTGDADKFGTLSVPVGAAGTVANDFSDLTSDDNLMPADTLVRIASDGGSTAGAATVSITIDWF